MENPYKPPQEWRHKERKQNRILIVIFIYIIGAAMLAVADSYHQINYIIRKYQNNEKWKFDKI